MYAAVCSDLCSCKRTALHSELFNILTYMFGVRIMDRTRNGRWLQSCDESDSENLYYFDRDLSYYEDINIEEI